MPCSAAVTHEQPLQISESVKVFFDKYKSSFATVVIMISPEMDVHTFIACGAGAELVFSYRSAY
jgi:hypothetical protein